MSAHDEAIAAALARIALAYDGVFFGIAVAVISIKTILKYQKFSSALFKIRQAPYVRVSGLHALLSSSGGDNSNENLVIVRGHVQPKSDFDGTMSSREKVLVSHESGQKAVLIQRTQTCLYNEWRGLFGWTFELRGLLSRHQRAHGATSLQAVPFVLTDGGIFPWSGYVVVNLDGSSHPLPLTTVYHQLHPVQAPALTFLQAVLGHGYPIGILDEEKVLPLGKEVTAIGICSSRDGALEIKASNEIPYFLSGMTKDEIEVDLAMKSNILLWGCIFLGTMSVSVLCYSIIRNWSKWKEWRQRRHHFQEQRDVHMENDEIESREVPDGELCVICLMRRRGSAFIPCGHLVCCPRCAITLEHETTPKCPVCRQFVHASVRIYAS